MNRRSFATAVVAIATVATLPALASGPRHIVLKDGDDLSEAMVGMLAGDTLTANGVELCLTRMVDLDRLPKCMIFITNCRVLYGDGAFRCERDLVATVHITDSIFIGRR